MASIDTENGSRALGSRKKRWKVKWQSTAITVFICSHRPHIFNVTEWVAGEFYQDNSRCGMSLMWPTTPRILREHSISMYRRKNRTSAKHPAIETGQSILTRLILSTTTTHRWRKWGQLRLVVMTRCIICLRRTRKTVFVCLYAIDTDIDKHKINRQQNGNRCNRLAQVEQIQHKQNRNQQKQQQKQHNVCHFVFFCHCFRYT